MTDPELSVFDLVAADADHRDAARALEAAGWRPCGAGDWAVAHRSPSGTRAARLSPFDPCAPYAARFYREAAHTGQVPRLDLELALEGGGHALVMEYLTPVDETTARAFLADVRGASALAQILASVHASARRELPWCGPVDDNPASVMRGSDGRLVLVDPFFADGPHLYGSILTDAAAVARSIPPEQRRHLLDIPLAGSGPWDEEVRERMRRALADADRRDRAHQTHEPHRDESALS